MFYLLLNLSCDTMSEAVTDISSVGRAMGGGAGFRSRSREPAIKIDGSETLRHPVDILLLELMKAYIF